MVLRHDHDPARAALGRDLARICRARRLVLVVAGDGRLAAALKAGVHLRGGYWPEPLRPTGSVTSSAHSVRDLKRAQRAGAELIFLSPAFPTASHAGAPGLGPLRWAAIARRGGSAGRVAALGGVDGSTVKRLPRRWCRAIGAIGALPPPRFARPTRLCGRDLSVPGAAEPARPSSTEHAGVVFDAIGARKPAVQGVPMRRPIEHMNSGGFRARAHVRVTCFETSGLRFCRPCGHARPPNWLSWGVCGSKSQTSTCPDGSGAQVWHLPPGKSPAFRSIVPR